MACGEHRVRFRVRYSETDQMGTFYNSRVLEWFECGRTEWLRGAGMPYTEMETRGVCLPVIEAHVRYLGRARYDDELEMRVSAGMSGKASVRFDVRISQAHSGQGVAEGYTVHAVTGIDGKPVRPPMWLVPIFSGSSEQ
ncbi:MAG: thioesterase family protein [Phycisphaerae bacterium]|nr:thioesterase family protein [Phycisphaerae bacterium]